MKPTFKIDEKLLDNQDRFEDPFYKRFKLHPAAKPLELSDKVSKNYLFPTFYGDVTCAMAVFLCSYEKAGKLMLHPKIKPVKMPKGRSVVAFSCCEYKNVLGVAPYNEIAMTIPILVDPMINLPVLPMLLGGFPKFGYYVFSMPVTSLENQLRGLKIWGLPKVVHQIDVTEKDGQCVTVDYEESGEPYFELKVPTEGQPIKFDVSSNLYTRLGDRFLQSETNFKATFAVNKNPQVLLNKGLPADEPALKIADTPSGRVLRDLEIEEIPLQFRFARGMTSCFDLPNPAYRSPISF